MRILFLISLFLFSVNVLFAQNLIQDAIDHLKSDPDLENSTISFQVTEAGTNKKIASLNPTTAIPTASTAKLFSTAIAIDILGPNYRPTTRIYTDGKIENGILKGNLYIRGGGDVSLGSKYFIEEGHESDFLRKWVDTLKKIGIKQIDGNITVDGSDFGYMGIPDGWAWSDMGNYYGAGPSGICIYDNTIRFYFKTGGTPGSKATLINTFPKVPELDFRNGITAQNVSGDNSYIYGSPYSNDRFSTGSLPLNNSSFEVKGSLPDPEWQLASELFDALNQAGIVVKGAAVSYRKSGITEKFKYDETFKLVYTHYGKTVSEIATLTNMKSINLFAEGLLSLIGYKQSGKGTTEEGLKYLRNYLDTKMSLQGLFLEDGSGLSRSNGISASHFCGLLNVMYNSPNYKSFFATLPEAGKSGTISSLCKGQSGHGRIFAKSGTMARTKSYAGYVLSRSGKKLIFSITVVNFNCSSSSLVKKMEPVLNAISIY